MTRPQMIRADTIDLQSPESPSAKDHTRQPVHPGPLGDGPPAPHQAIALKNAEQEVEFHPRSPRMSQDLSNKELQLLHEDSDDSTNATGSDQEHHGLQRNGILNGTAGEDGEMGDAEGDDGLDDDMMDKMSSSPSIEDGGYNLLLHWPHRDDSLITSVNPQEKAAPPPPKHDACSSSPFLSPPVYFPLFYPQKNLALDPLKDHHHRHQGEYPVERSSLDSVGEESEEYSHERAHDSHKETGDSRERYEDDSDTDDLYNMLLPADDSLLDNSFDDAPLSPTRSALPLDGQSTDEYDDDTNNFSYSDDSRFIDSGWGGECLREVEDIDFNFVYALHTFVATVEGQANATKGDTMMLLDDTNSYWWLVRVVKDNSIGYLPAEHIETPTERLARLNKHRNVDLSQAMLGDSPEKSKNPLKKAMRRRNGKTVQFAAPTYRDPPMMDYSTEEEDNEDGDGQYGTSEEESNDAQNEDPEKDLIESTTTEPQLSRGQEIENEVGDPKASLDSRDTEDQNTLIETEHSSDEPLERSDDSTSGKSRKGTLRNTDSFFKDDNLETRKINLTPSLLRDERPNEARESKPRGSIDSLEKSQTPPDKINDKKRREKKGMLGNLFKRKDKRSRWQEDEIEDSKKLSEESLRESPQPKESLESSFQETQVAKSTPQQQPQKQASKLQKAPPTKLSPGKAQPPRLESKSTALESQIKNLPQPERLAPQMVDYVAPAPAPQPEPEKSNTLEFPHKEFAEIEPSKDSRRGLLSPVRDVLASTTSNPKPEKLKVSKHRMPLDDSDSSPGDDQPPGPIPESKVHDSSMTPVKAVKERLSESPVEVASPGKLAKSQTPALVVDTSSQEYPSNSPTSLVSSPELVEAPRDEEEREGSPASTAQSSNNTPTWSDANLRAYLDDDSDIRDLLVVVNDKSDVKPADPDHPLVKDLFKEENRKLGEISTQLDGMLGDWLAKKSKHTKK